MQIWHQSRVRQRGITGPNPDEAMLFDDRQRGYAGGGVNGVLARHVNAAAVAVIAQAVIAADHGITVQMPHAERQKAVPACVVQGGRCTVRPAEQHDFTPGDGACDQRALHLNVPGGGIPGVGGPIRPSETVCESRNGRG